MLGGGGLLVASAIGCSNSDDSGASGFGDASVPLDASRSPDAEAAPDASPDGGGPCSSNADCPSDLFECVYPIAEQCAATARCVAIPQPACQSATSACACDGGAAVVPCYFSGPNGYATAPITGIVSDVPGPDGGLVSECLPFRDASTPDAGDASADAGADAADAADAGDGGA